MLLFGPPLEPDGPLSRTTTASFRVGSLTRSGFSFYASFFLRSLFKNAPVNAHREQRVSVKTGPCRFIPPVLAFPAVYPVCYLPLQSVPNVYDVYLFFVLSAPRCFWIGISLLRHSYAEFCYSCGRNTVLLIILAVKISNSRPYLGHLLDEEGMFGQIVGRSRERRRCPYTSSCFRFLPHLSFLRNLGNECL